VQPNFARTGSELDHEIAGTCARVPYDRARNERADIRWQTGALIIARRLVVKRASWAYG
jgi:hypothetical protein